jgi:parallel beta-helix repeat protein
MKKNALWFILGSFLLLLTLTIPPNVAPWKGAASTPPAEGGEWWVNDATVLDGTTTIFNGSIVINSTGSLTLTSATLIINGTDAASNGHFNITVLTGGSLLIQDGSNVTSTHNTGTYRYHIVIQSGAHFEVRNSFISNAGYNQNPGFLIEADDVIITNSSITSQADTPITIANAKNFAMENSDLFISSGDEYCISLTNVTHSSLDGNQLQITGDQNGIYLEDCSEIQVTNNLVNTSDSSALGVNIRWSNHSEISRNQINAANHGIALYEVLDCSVAENSVNSAQMGIRVRSNSAKLFIKNNVVNTTFGSLTGISIHDSNDTVISQNEIDAGGIGVYVTTSGFTQIEENWIISRSGNGIELDDLDSTAITNSTAIINNAISHAAENGLQANTATGILVQGNIIDYSAECGAMVSNSNNVTITDNLIRWSNFEWTPYEGLYASRVDYSRFYNNSILYTGGTGLEIRLSHNVTVLSSRIQYSGDHGLYLADLDDCLIANIASENSELAGIYLEESFNVTLANSVIQNNGAGIDIGLGAADNNTISGNSIENNAEYGIRIIDGDYNILLSNTISESNNGIQLMGSARYNSITGNSLFQNVYGINSGSSDADSNIVTCNEVFLNQRGIEITAADQWDITNNTIAWNAFIGLALLGTATEDHEIYYNNFIQNNIQARDTSNYGDNFWSLKYDVGTISFYFGNYWNDHHASDTEEPYGFYDTPYFLTGTPGIADFYPLAHSPVLMNPPQVDSPDDIAYLVETTGHRIIWNAFDWDPLNYSIYQDAYFLQKSSWNAPQSEIELSIDGLGLGEHIFRLVLHDQQGHSTIDEVTVTVIGTPTSNINSPVLSHLGNVPIPNDTATGYFLNWTAIDDDPGVYEIRINSTVNASGSWTNGSIISISLDGLANGTYNYTVIVWDLSGNNASDEVLVYVGVTDTTPPLIESFPDISYVVGTTGNSITWIASDQFGLNYTITRDDVVIESGSWDGGPITINVDGLAIGTYHYRLTVRDHGGYSASSDVVVQVRGALPETLTETKEEKDDQFMPGFLAGSAAMAFLGLLLLLMKKLFFGGGSGGDLYGKYP